MAFIDQPSAVDDIAHGTLERGAAGCAAGVVPQFHPAYLVPDWVRVRAEDFGLLIYDTRSTRLTFVRCGDRLVPPPFTGSRRELVVRADGEAGGEAGAGARPAGAALARVLDDLVAKGLLVAAAAH